MVKIDPEDDSRMRYIVWHHRFDESTNQFKRFAIATFDNEKEAKKLRNLESEKLAKNKESGLAHSREFFSTDCKIPGYSEATRSNRSLIRLFRRIDLSK